jgi:hypothetical protein
LLNFPQNYFHISHLFIIKNYHFNQTKFHLHWLHLLKLNLKYLIIINKKVLYFLFLVFRIKDYKEEIQKTPLIFVLPYFTLTNSIPSIHIFYLSKIFLFLMLFSARLPNSLNPNSKILHSYLYNSKYKIKTHHSSITFYLYLYILLLH